MDRETGRAISGLAQLRQTVLDVLTTPLGTRVIRRDYGSSLPDLLARPLNAVGLQRLRAATVLALARHAPRLAVRSVDIRMDGGSVTLALSIADLSAPATDRTLTAVSIPLTRRSP
jgi:uncharacterized protein